MKTIDELSWDIMYEVTESEINKNFSDRRLAVVRLLSKYMKSFNVEHSENDE